MSKRNRDNLGVERVWIERDEKMPSEKEKFIDNELERGRKERVRKQERETDRERWRERW
jgi:hypothetical protein